MTDLPGTIEEPADERRQAPRHVFGIVQRVAELVDGKEISADSHKRVQILDLSNDGFSYYTLSEPENDELIVVIGDPPDVLSLPARVVYSTVTEQCGHELYRIGCQFTGDKKLDAISVVLQQQSSNEHAMRQLEGLAELPDHV